MLKRILVAIIAFSAISFGYAAEYPEKPVRLVVSWAPGGAVDVIARKIAQKLSEQTKGTFIVENKPGASGTIGTQQVIRSAPDGYTLTALDNTIVFLPFVFKKLPWEQEMPLIPITVVAFQPIVLLVKSDSKFKTLSDLITYAKANPDTVTYGTGGAGSAPHFSAEAFQQANGIKLMHVPYKGAADAITGLISGQIDMVMVSTPSAASQLKSKRARALAISASSRLGSFPDIPTFTEAGMPGFGIVNWTGIAVPLGTPKEIVDFLYSEIRKALESPDMKEFLESMSANAGGISSEEFIKLIKSENSRWAEVARQAHIEKQ